MEVGWAAVIWGGLIATTIGTGVFWIFRAQRLTRLSPSRHLGCYLFPDPYRPQTDLAGLGVLFLLGTAVFPWLYLAVMSTVLPAQWWAGAVIGTAHGVLAGAALPYLGRVNRCIRSGVIDGPGPFGVELGRGTPVAIVVAHGIYGVLIAVIVPAFM